MTGKCLPNLISAGPPPYIMVAGPTVLYLRLKRPTIKEMKGMEKKKKTEGEEKKGRRGKGGDGGKLITIMVT